MKIQYILLILSSSLILSGCYPRSEKYLIRSATSNDSNLNSVLAKRINKFVSVNKMKTWIDNEINAFIEHGYPFAYGIMNIRSKNRVADIKIDIEKGDYVIIKNVFTNLKSAKNYVNVWGNTVTGKSYKESSVMVLSRKIASLSFVDSRGDFEIIRDKNDYSLYFPLKENNRNVISGHLSYDDKTVNGRVSFTSNSFLGKSGHFGFYYENMNEIKEFQLSGALINIGYGDFDAGYKLHYSTEVDSDYLVKGEVTIGYKSYNVNHFALGIGIYRGLSFGNTKYVFIENRLGKNAFSLTWHIEGNQSDSAYYSNFGIKAQFSANHGKVLFLSSFLGNYIYPLDSLPLLMHFNLSGFNGVRGYKSMSYSADKFMMLREDILYRFNNFVTAGINTDGAYFGDIIYSFGITTVLSLDKSKMKIYIAAPGWNKLNASVISGEISYVF